MDSLSIYGVGTRTTARPQQFTAARFIERGSRPELHLRAIPITESVPGPQRPHAPRQTEAKSTNKIPDLCLVPTHEMICYILASDSLALDQAETRGSRNYPDQLEPCTG